MRYGLGVLLLERSLADGDVGAVAAAAEALSRSLRLGRTSSWTYAALDPTQLPESYRDLAAWARRLGVGDDICRRLPFERLSPTEGRELVETVRAHAGTAHAWLDTFGQEAMTREAAAVMFLLLGVEEEHHVIDRARGQ